MWSTVGAWLAARNDDGDGWTAGVVARGAALIVCLSGSLVSLSLARPSDGADAFRSLAASRGFSARVVAKAELIASIWLASEAVAAPGIALAVACALLARDPSAAAGLPVFGSAVFAIVAAIALGTISDVCRKRGGNRARTWLVAITVLPWIAGEAFLAGRGGEYVSIPGLLSWSWHLLTGGQ